MAPFAGAIGQTTRHLLGPIENIASGRLTRENYISECGFFSTNKFLSQPVNRVGKGFFVKTLQFRSPQAELLGRTPVREDHRQIIFIPASLASSSRTDLVSRISDQTIYTSAFKRSSGTWLHFLLPSRTQCPASRNTSENIIHSYNASISQNPEGVRLPFHVNFPICLCHRSKVSFLGEHRRAKPFVSQDFRTLWLIPTCEYGLLMQLNSVKTNDRNERLHLVQIQT